MRKIMKKMLKDNRGVSLTELMIVIAIMSVLAGVLSYGYSTVSAKNATQCAKNVELAIEKNRVNVLGKKSGSVKFYYGTDGIYCQESFDGTAEKAIKIGKDDVKITYGSGSYAGEISSAVNNVLTVEFNRSDGSLKSSIDSFPIVVSKGRKSYTISVDELTGRVTVN